MNMSEDYFQQVLIWIDLRLTQKITVSDVAVRLGLSRRHSQRIFRKFTGRSIIDYVIQRKVERTAMLLINSELTLNDIAFKYGWDSQQSFSKCFKQRLGITPGSLRKKLSHDNITLKDYGKNYMSGFIFHE